MKPGRGSSRYWNHQKLESSWTTTRIARISAIRSAPQQASRRAAGSRVLSARARVDITIAMRLPGIEAPAITGVALPTSKEFQPS